MLVTGVHAQHVALMQTSLNLHVLELQDLVSLTALNIKYQLRCKKARFIDIICAYILAIQLRQTYQWDASKIYYYNSFVK